MAPHYTRKDFDFVLPETLIAQFPTGERTASRLLHVTPTTVPPFSDRKFSDLPDLVVPGDLLVFNDTKVIKARFYAKKASGGRVELLVERLIGVSEALVQMRASHAPANNSLLTPEKDSAVAIRVLGREDRFYHVRFEGTGDVVDWLDQHGQMPLPPYIHREVETTDEARYQTVYARVPGAVAAPTAGLHFDQTLLDRLAARGVRQAWVTLHVGAGTFQPVQEEDLSKHIMHRELYDIPKATAEAIAATKAAGGRVIGVGTTSLRALESAADDGGQVHAGRAETGLFITPGYRFKVIDRLVTNFHLPCSTLMMLVSAFGGYDVLRAAYSHAIAEHYRFFSYGDAMLIERA